MSESDRRAPKRDPAIGALAPLRAAWARVPGNARGATWMVLGTLAFLCGQAVAKSLSPEIHAFELTFFRCAFSFVVLLPLVMRTGAGAFKTRRPHLHLARGLAGGLAMLGVFYGITHMPLANVNTIGFTKPLFMILLAVLFLGEPVRVRRWIATVVGFGGVVLMLRPGVGGFEPAAYVVLGAAALHAIAHVFLKKLSGRESPVGIAAWYMLIAALVTLVPAAFVWVWPDPVQLFWLVMVGAFTGVGQSFLAMSFRAGDATVIAPFDYARLLWATGFDVMLFAAFPDLWTVAGALVIVASTFYIGRRGATVESAEREGRAA